MKNINIVNKRASFEFELFEKFVAGIQLTGTEIKSIRAGKASMGDAFCYIRNYEVFVKNLHISEYSAGTHWNHNPLRERKLLLKKKEIFKLRSKSEEKGFTIIPTRLFINERGFAKLEIALAKGKKLHDKREAIKKREVDREIKKGVYLID
ncbi:MAG: SsrA-binding protein SmpB [Bacteroidetes bacterium]|nr:SsrA-binding protein SmpB [Bacteroidota bacterium]